MTNLNESLDNANIFLEKKEEILNRWLNELESNPHYSQTNFQNKDQLILQSKELFDVIIRSFSSSDIPDLSNFNISPLLKLWHSMLRSQQEIGGSTKDTAFLIFSLKATLVNFLKDYFKHEEYVYNPDIAKFTQLLDIFGLLTFEVYSSESEKLLDQKEEQIKYLLNTSNVPSKFTRLIGSSPQMMAVYKAIGLVLENDVTVLLQGESGTGKDLVANIIHNNSKRQKKPFVVVNCGAIPKDLMESELFGHEKGSFTGATESRLGKFELANGGTLFLDEIGELDLALQVKLLRVLQTKELERVGGQNKIKVDVRIITATNKDLKKEVDNHRFRLDLFYRINVFPIQIPPLRERKSDIIPIAQHFIKYYQQQYNVKNSFLTKNAAEFLINQYWEGNVRELENVIQRSVLIARGKPITAEILAYQPGSYHSQLLEPPKTDVSRETLLQPSAFASQQIQTLDEIEKQAILNALKIQKGNIRQVAKSLGISRTTLYNKAKKYEIKLGGGRI